MVLTLNRPAKRNALSKALVADLLHTFADIGSDAANRCAVITGAPPAFCAGGDLSELRTADDEETTPRTAPRTGRSPWRSATCPSR